jgi:hypothetical protein
MELQAIREVNKDGAPESDPVYKADGYPVLSMLAKKWDAKIKHHAEKYSIEAAARYYGIEISTVRGLFPE